MRLVLAGLPRPATFAEYSQAGEELEHALIRLPGAVAVYRYGSITAPGISDLDRLVVTEDDRLVPPIWPRLSERTRYLAMHTPTRVTAETFRRHRWFADLGKLELVWGSAVSIEERPVPEYSEPLLAAEALVVMALKLLKLSVTNRAKVRSWLCELSNIRVDLQFARIERTDAPRAWALADEVAHLRQEWWEIPPEERRTRVVALLEAGLPAVNQALHAFPEPDDAPVAHRPLNLGAPWKHMRLHAGIPRPRSRRASAGGIIGRSRRLGESLWRLRERELYLPAGVVALVAGPPPDAYVTFRSERDRLLEKQRISIASTPGYSGVRLGVTLVDDA